jgi:hypothetical protein
MEYVNNNWDNTYKVKNNGLRFPGAPQGSLKGHKAPKLASKCVMTGYILL